jgi:hypothetical protein
MGARTRSFARSAFLGVGGLALGGGPAQPHGGATTPPGGGGGQATGGGTGSGGAASGPVDDAAVTPAAMCGAIFRLASSGCELTAGYALSREECEADYRRSLSDRGPAAHDATLIAGHCLLDQSGCGEVTACFDAMSSGANNGEPEEYRACSQRDVYAPVGLSQADFDRRKGATTRRFSEAASTKDDPIAVCGIRNEMTWLLAGTCDDGTNPYQSFDHAHASRVGNVGPGGLCGSIIDLYEVPCPEGTYAIYIDAYVCPVPAGQPVPHD